MTAAIEPVETCPRKGGDGALRLARQAEPVVTSPTDRYRAARSSRRPGLHRAEREILNETVQRGGEGERVELGRDHAAVQRPGARRQQAEQGRPAGWESGEHRQ